MNANQLNAEFRKAGLRVRLVRGKGYYYWIGSDAPSVFVYRASDLPLNQWMALAKEAETYLAP